MEISVWPDGTFCEKGDEGSYLQWMSDDYITLDIDEYIADALYNGSLDAQDLLDPSFSVENFGK